MNKVLLVDDEPQILRFLGPTLRAAGYEVALAETGAQALEVLARETVAAIVLDLGLPDGDGKDLIDPIRALTPAPIIVLSARESEAEKIQALDRGANDYVVKPFAVGELMARLRVALRTDAPRPAPNPLVRVRGGHIDLSRRRAVLDGLEVRLTRRETDFLRVLAAAKGEVVSNRELLAQIWGENGIADAQFVRALASQVRQKIELERTSRIVITEPGLGYRLEIGSAQEPDQPVAG